MHIYDIYFFYKIQILTLTQPKESAQDILTGIQNCKYLNTQHTVILQY